MMLSLAYLILFGMGFYFLFKALKLPGLIGMLLAGVLIGPYGIDLLDSSLLAISSDLRMIALIVILLRAGLGIKPRALKPLGGTLVRLSVLPVILEGFAILLLAMMFFDFTFEQGGLLGFIIAAVSPAIVVPSMLRLMKEKIGETKRIPLLVLSAASIDDVIAITFFSVFLSAYFSLQSNWVLQITMIPVAIILGILLGVIVGFVMIYVFNRFHFRDSQKVIMLLAAGIFMVSFSQSLESVIMIAALLGVMTVGIIITEKKEVLSQRLAIKFDKIWVLVELFLFVLVGAAVNVQVALDVSIIGVFIILVGLCARIAGVYLATINTGLKIKEKLFVGISFTPKATVQAAMGAIPLTLGIPGGDIILALSVFAILVTAPMGAIGIQYGAKFLLNE